MTKKWSKINEVFKDSAQTSVAIFLAEIMEIIDCHPCEFKCEKYYEGDMFGGRDEKWELSTKNLKISRHWEQEINESWQSITVHVNKTEVIGFKEGQGINWDGDSDLNFIGTELILLKINEETEKKILDVAMKLFPKVGIERLRYYT